VIEQPVNLSTVSYLGVFSRAEQRVLQAIFKAIAEGGGRCVATLATLARDSNTSKSTTRNAIARAVAIGLLEKTERRSYCAVSLPNIFTYAEAGRREPPACFCRRAPAHQHRHCQRLLNGGLTCIFLDNGLHFLDNHSGDYDAGA
jgi:hypothetical protein